MPVLHGTDATIRFGPITGMRGEPGRLRLNEWSRLLVRLPDGEIRTVLQLSRVGLSPSSTSRNRTSSLPPPAKLAEIGIAGIGDSTFDSGSRTGQPRRRVVRVKGQKIIGYALIVSELTAEESIRLQECGLGGRTRMGWGSSCQRGRRSDEHLLKRCKDYKEVMQKEIDRRFGPDALDKIADAARDEYKKRTGRKNRNRLFWQLNYLNFPSNSCSCDIQEHN